MESQLKSIQINQSRGVRIGKIFSLSQETRIRFDCKRNEWAKLGIEKIMNVPPKAVSVMVLRR